MVNIKAALESIVGAENVSGDDYELIAYSRDMSQYPAKKADFIVLPTTTQQVSDIMHLANITKTPVYVKGGGTGSGGMNIARIGGIIIDLIKMSKILEINEKHNTITTQAGCSVYHAVQELRKKGLRLALWPEFGSSVPMAGWTACTGVGINCFSQNYLWDSLCGMEVVLPTGEIIRTGGNAYSNCGPLNKYSAIADFSGIFCCSQGAFGVITELTYMIFPIEEVVETIHFGWNDWEPCLELIRKLQRTQHTVQELALVDPAVGKIMCGVEIKFPRIVIIQVAGTKEQVEVNARIVRKLAAETGATEVDAPVGQALHDNGSMLNGPSKVVGGYDAIASQGCALEALPEMYRIVDEECKKENIPSFTYVWITRTGAVPFPSFIFQDPQQNELMTKVRLAIYDRWMKLKDVPGSYYAPFPDFAHYFRPTYYEFVRKIKRTLDPNNILQPGMAPS